MYYLNYLKDQGQVEAITPDRRRLVSGSLPDGVGIILAVFRICPLIVPGPPDEQVASYDTGSRFLQDLYPLHQGLWDLIRQGQFAEFPEVPTADEHGGRQVGEPILSPELAIIIDSDIRIRHVFTGNGLDKGIRINKNLRSSPYGTG